MEMYPYWLRHYIWVDPILNFFFYRRVKFTYKKYTDMWMSARMLTEDICVVKI